MVRLHVLCKIAALVIGMGSVNWVHAQPLTGLDGVPSNDATHLRDFLAEPAPTFEQALAISADEAFTRFRQTVGVAGQFMARSQGVLIFQNISRTGMLVGSARGDGMLVVSGQKPRFFRQESNSIGLQLGVQRYSQVYVFLQPQALAAFLANPDKLNLGAEATVAVGYAGAQDSVDTNANNG